MIVVTSSVLFGRGKPRPRAKVRGPVRGSCRLGTSFFTYTSHSSLIDKLLVDQGSPPPNLAMALSACLLGYIVARRSLQSTGPSPPPPAGNPGWLAPWPIPRRSHGATSNMTA